MTILVKDANGNNQTVSTADEVVSAIGAQNALLGEVQASPTANTMLDRLKAINTSVGSGNTALTTLNTSVGAVNTSVGTVNTTLGTVKTSVDAVKTSVDAVTTKLNGTLTVTGALTDTQLRASAVPVSGPLTDTQLRASLVAVSAQMASGGNIAVQTAATGTNYTAFASQACKQLTIVNDSGATVVFQQGGSGVAVPVLDGTAFTIFGISNANQIGLKRKDDSNTQVTIAARWEA